jgi:hypothetical protein
VSIWRLVIFLSVISAILGGVHYFLWARLIRDVELPATARTALTWLLIALALTVPLSMMLTRQYVPGNSRLIYFLGYGWMGVMFVLFVSLLAGDLVRLAVWLATRGTDAIDDGRRTVLARAIGGVATLLGAAAGTLGAVAAYRPEITRTTVPLARLSKAMSGTRIVQLTDVHVGPTIGREHIERLVAMTNALEPDIIAITGDLVDGSVEALRTQVEPLSRLRAKHGVFFVTGNHEYYSGATEWVAHLATLGIRVLRNEHVAIGGEQGFDLAGVDDFRSVGLAPGHGHDVVGALAGRDPKREVVLLAHQPKSIKEAARLGVGLQISGHTHAGQIWPWRYAVFLDQPFVDGLHKLQETWIYVSRGTGFWGPPMRVGAAAEIAEITLVSA